MFDNSGDKFLWIGEAGKVAAGHGNESFFRSADLFDVSPGIVEGHDVIVAALYNEERKRPIEAQCSSVE
jgi:hypothetical protein